MDPLQNIVHDNNLSYPKFNIQIEKPTVQSDANVQKNDSEFLKIVPTTGKTSAKILNINVSTQPASLHHGVSSVILIKN